MNEEELLYALALNYSNGLGVIRVKKMIEAFGSAKNAWYASKKDLYAIVGVGLKTMEHFPSNANLQKAEREINFCKQSGVKLLYYKNADYPTLLKETPDCPAVLFQKGNYDFSDQILLSFVGTRKISTYGKGQTEEIVSGLHGQPITIVSGLAYGVDIYAHKAAIEHGLPTLAILAHGLQKVYPSVHKKYAEQIIQEGGALISEFTSSHGMEREYFLQRNRIIAGLSIATIVIESDIKGGALSTAKFANHYNREVFALPGRVDDQYSSGCNHLVKTHQAQLLTSYKDILDFLNLQVEKKKEKQLGLAINLESDLQEIYDLLFEKGKMQIDEISLQLGKPSYLILTHMLDMELMGIIKGLPGKYFELIQ